MATTSTKSTLITVDQYERMIDAGTIGEDEPAEEHGRAHEHGDRARRRPGVVDGLHERVDEQRQSAGHEHGPQQVE